MRFIGLVRTRTYEYTIQPPDGWLGLRQGRDISIGPDPLSSILFFLVVCATLAPLVQALVELVRGCIRPLLVRLLPEAAKPRGESSPSFCTNAQHASRLVLQPIERSAAVQGRRMHGWACCTSSQAAV